MSRKDKSDKSPAGQRDVDDDLAQALVTMGWLVPTSEGQVTAAARALADMPPLPEALCDPEMVFQRPERPAHAGKTLPLPDEPDIEATIRRAARQAGSIPPEIERQMQRDRRAAERQLDRDDDDQDQS